MSASCFSAPTVILSSLSAPIVILVSYFSIPSTTFPVSIPSVISVSSVSDPTVILIFSSVSTSIVVLLPSFFSAPTTSISVSSSFVTPTTLSAFLSLLPLLVISSFLVQTLSSFCIPNFIFIHIVVERRERKGRRRR
mmetsp:Transcript_3751/g.5705  ORF Transcript_3751/g.5705 Transcript_3751/m.5705 type:complete len:137 (-) Transcript_3751:180-590(-)